MKKKKVFICIFIFAIVVSFFLETNRDYVIGKITSVEIKTIDNKKRYVADIYVTETSLDKDVVLNKHFEIFSYKKIEIDNIVKLRFKNIPFEKVVIMVKYPISSFSKNYYLDILEK